MQRIVTVALLSAWCSVALAQWDTRAQLRGQWDSVRLNADSPLSLANTVASDTVAQPTGAATLQLELHASRPGLLLAGMLESRHREGGATSSRGQLNELVVSRDAGAWQFAAGKKVLAWDVGYGFRPNDMVQQEERRTFATSAAPGRAMLVAEYFDATTAWAFAWVNPTHGKDRLGAQENALASRVYRRDGAVDWHGFARWGQHTGAGLGGAVAWVASDALELHGSWRYQRRMDTLAYQGAGTLQTDNPWRDASTAHVQQLLLGGTWTHSSQLSLLMEAWWDGAALSNAQWDAWNANNGNLLALVGKGPPSSAIAGNLAWSASAFGASANLRRANVFMRASWQSGAWQSTLDLLYTPADAGRLLTASLQWQGDRVLVQAGVRANAGPRSAVLAQLPSRAQSYLNATWSF